MKSKISKSLDSLKIICDSKMISKECKELLSTELVSMDFELQNIDSKINEFYHRFIHDIEFLVKLKERIYSMLNNTDVDNPEHEHIRNGLHQTIAIINKQIKLKEVKQNETIS